MAHEERTIDFGIVAVGYEESKSIVITNSTETDKVYNVRRDTDSYSIRRVFHIDSTEFTLLPGESYSMNVKFRPDVPFTTCIEYIHICDKQGMRTFFTVKGETIGPYVVPTKKNLLFETFQNITEQTEFELKNVSNVQVTVYFDNDNENSIFKFYPRISKLEGPGSLTVVAQFTPLREGSYEKKVYCLVEHQNPILFHLIGLNGRFPINGVGPTLLKFPLLKTERFERNNYEGYLRCEWDRIVKLEPKYGVKILKGSTYETLYVTNITDYTMMLVWETESLNVFRVAPTSTRLSPGATVKFNIRYDPIKVFNANSEIDKCLEAVNTESPMHSVDLEGWLYWEYKDIFLNMVPDPWFFAQDYEEDRWKYSKTPVNITVKLIGNYLIGERKSRSDCVLFPNPLIFPSSFDGGGAAFASFQIRNLGQYPVLYRLIPPTQTNFIAKPMEGFIKDGMEIVIAKLGYKNGGEVSHLESWIIEFDGYIKSKQALTFAGARESLDVRIGDLDFPAVQLGCCKELHAVIRNLSTAWIRLECDQEETSNSVFKATQKECLLPPNGLLRHLWISRPSCTGMHSAYARYKGKAVKDPKIAELDNFVVSFRMEEDNKVIIGRKEEEQEPWEVDIRSPYPFRNERLRNEDIFTPKEFGINMKINCLDDTIIAQPKVILHTDFVANQPVMSSFMLCNLGEAFVPYSMILVHLPEHNDKGTDYDHKGQVDEKFYDLNPREGVLSPKSSISVSYTIFPYISSNYGVLMDIAGQCENGVVVPSSGKNICYINCEGRWPSVRITDLKLPREEKFFGKYLLWKALDMTRLNKAMKFSSEPNSKSFRLNLPERPFQSPPITYCFCLRNYSVLPVQWTLNIIHGKLKIQSTSGDDRQRGRKMASKTVEKALSCLRELVRVQRSKAIENGDPSYLQRVDCCVESEQKMMSAIVTRKECPLGAIVNIEPKQGFIMPGRAEVIEMTVLHELFGEYTFSYAFNVRVSTFDNNPVEFKSINEDRQSFSESDAQSKEYEEDEEGVRSTETAKDRKSSERKEGIFPLKKTAPFTGGNATEGCKEDGNCARSRSPANAEEGSADGEMSLSERKMEANRVQSKARLSIKPWKAKWTKGLSDLWEYEARGIRRRQSDNEEDRTAFPKVPLSIAAESAPNNIYDDNTGIAASSCEEYRGSWSSSDDSHDIADELIPCWYYANICDHILPRYSEQQQSATKDNGELAEENDSEGAWKATETESFPENKGGTPRNFVGEEDSSRITKHPISATRERCGSLSSVEGFAAKESNKSGLKYGKHLSILRGGRLLTSSIHRSIVKQTEPFSRQKDAIGKISGEGNTSDSNLVRKFEDLRENNARKKDVRSDKESYSKEKAKERICRSFRCKDSSGSVRISPSSLEVLGLGSTDEVVASIYTETPDKDGDSEETPSAEVIRITVNRNGCKERSAPKKGISKENKSKTESKGFASKERTEGKNGKLVESEGRTTTEAKSSGKKRKNEGKNRVEFSSRDIDEEKKESEYTATKSDTTVERSKCDKSRKKDLKSGKGNANNKVSKSEESPRSTKYDRCTEFQSEKGDRRRISEKCCKELAEPRAECKKRVKRPRFARSELIRRLEFPSKRIQCVGGGYGSQAEGRSDGSATEVCYMKGVARLERLKSLGDMVCIKDNKYMKGESVVEAIKDMFLGSRAKQNADINTSKVKVGVDLVTGDSEARAGEKYAKESDEKGDGEPEEVPNKPKTELESEDTLKDFMETEGEAFAAASKMQRSVDKRSSRKYRRETDVIYRRGRSNAEEVDRDLNGKEDRKKTRKELFRSIRPDAEELKRVFSQIKLLRSFSILSICEEAEEAITNQGRKRSKSESPGRRSRATSKITSMLDIGRGKAFSESPDKAKSTVEIPSWDKSNEINTKKTRKKQKNASRKNEAVAPLDPHPLEAAKREEDSSFKTTTEINGDHSGKHPQKSILRGRDEVQDSPSEKNAMAGRNGGFSRETSELEMQRQGSEPPCWKKWIFAAEERGQEAVESDLSEVLKGKTIKECVEFIMEEESNVLYQWNSVQKGNTSSKDWSRASSQCTISSGSVKDDKGESKAMISDKNAESVGVLWSNTYETETKRKTIQEGMPAQSRKVIVEKRGSVEGFKTKPELKFSFEPVPKKTNKELIGGDISMVKGASEENGRKRSSDVINEEIPTLERDDLARKFNIAANESLMDEITDPAMLIDTNQCGIIRSESVDFRNSAEVENIRGYFEQTNLFRQKGKLLRNPFPPLAVNLELDITVTTYDNNEETPSIYPRLYDRRIKMADVSVGNNYSPIQVSWLYNPHVEKCCEYLVKEIVYPQEKRIRSNQPVEGVYEIFTSLNPKGRIKPHGVHPLLLRFDPQMAKHYKAVIRISYENAIDQEITIQGRGVRGKALPQVMASLKKRTHSEEAGCETTNSEVYLSQEMIIIDKPIPLHCEAKRLVYMKNSSHKDFFFVWKTTECQGTLERMVVVSIEPRNGIIRSNQAMPFIVSFSNATNRRTTRDESKREYISRNRERADYGMDADAVNGTESSSSMDNQKDNSDSESMSRRFIFVPSDVILYYEKQVSSSAEFSPQEVLTSDDASANKKNEEERQNYFERSIAPMIGETIAEKRRENCPQSTSPSTSPLLHPNGEHRDGIEGSGHSSRTDENRNYTSIDKSTEPITNVGKLTADVLNRKTTENLSDPSSECEEESKLADKTANVYCIRGTKLVEWLLIEDQNGQMDTEADDVFDEESSTRNVIRTDDCLLCCGAEKEPKTSDDRGNSFEQDRSLLASDEAQDTSETTQSVDSSNLEAMRISWSEGGEAQSGGLIIDRYPLTCELNEATLGWDREEGNVRKETLYKCVHISGALYDEEVLEDIPSEMRANWSPNDSASSHRKRQVSEENEAILSKSAGVVIKDVLECILWKLLHSEWFEITRKRVAIEKKEARQKESYHPGEEEATAISSEESAPFYYNQIVTTDESPFARHLQGGNEESNRGSPSSVVEVFEEQSLVARKLGEWKSLVREEKTIKEGEATFSDNKLLRYRFPRIIASTIFEDLITGFTRSIAEQSFNSSCALTNGFHEYEQ